jgi:hypothetical protein
VISEGDGRGYGRPGYDPTYHVTGVALRRARTPPRPADCRAGWRRRSRTRRQRPARLTTRWGGGADPAGRGMDGWQYLQWGSGAQRVRRAGRTAPTGCGRTVLDGMQRRWGVREGGFDGCASTPGTTTRVWKESAFHDPATEAAVPGVRHDGAGRVVRVTSADGTAGRRRTPSPDRQRRLHGAAGVHDPLGRAGQRDAAGPGRAGQPGERVGVERRGGGADPLRAGRAVAPGAGGGRGGQRVEQGLGLARQRACGVRPRPGLLELRLRRRGNRVSSTARGQTVAVVADAVGRVQASCRRRRR